MSEKNRNSNLTQKDVTPKVLPGKLPAKMFENIGFRAPSGIVSNTPPGTNTKKQAIQTTVESLKYYGTYTPRDNAGVDKGSPSTGTWEYIKSDKTYTGTWTPDNGKAKKHTCTGSWNDTNNKFHGNCDDGTDEDYYGTWTKLTIADKPIGKLTLKNSPLLNNMLINKHESGQKNIENIRPSVTDPVEKKKPLLFLSDIESRKIEGGRKKYKVV